MHVATFYGLTLFSGLFYYVLLSAVAAGGAGLNPQTAVPIVAALLLGGIGPGLALTLPRAAAWFVVALSVFFVGYILMVVIGPPGDPWALVAGLPAVASLLSAFFAHRRSPDSVWQRRPGRKSRLALALAITLPAIPALWLIVGILTAV
jgi:hypothetical protein